MKLRLLTEAETLWLDGDASFDYSNVRYHLGEFPFYLKVFHGIRDRRGEVHTWCELAGALRQEMVFEDLGLAHDPDDWSRRVHSVLGPLILDEDVISITPPQFWKALLQATADCGQSESCYAWLDFTCYPHFEGSLPNWAFSRVFDTRISEIEAVRALSTGDCGPNAVWCPQGHWAVRSTRVHSFTLVGCNPRLGAASIEALRAEGGIELIEVDPDRAIDMPNRQHDGW